MRQLDLLVLREFEHLCPGEMPVAVAAAMVCRMYADRHDTRHGLALTGIDGGGRPAVHGSGSCRADTPTQEIALGADYLAGTSARRFCATQQAFEWRCLIIRLLVCGCCGGSYTLVNKTRYGCASVRNKGEAVCGNRASIQREEVEDRVLGGLKQKLLLLELIEEYRKAWNAAQAGISAGREKQERELAQLEKKIAAILAAIEDGFYHASMKAKMAELEATKAQLTASLAASPEPPALRLHPSLTGLYQQKIADLAAALSDPAVTVEAAETLRGLVSEIRMNPDPDAPGGHHIELAGKLAGILALGGPDTTKPPRMARAGSDSMVAGGRSQKYCNLHSAERLPPLAA
ncbi:recombinase zinc beta ribbon domain-containing protein [Frigidibacter albus]|nr:recombinase zinc beta ribbon domain-containing protein [Frigidibacter albus]